MLVVNSPFLTASNFDRSVLIPVIIQITGSSVFSTCLVYIAVVTSSTPAVQLPLSYVTFFGGLSDNILRASNIIHLLLGIFKSISDNPVKNGCKEVISSPVIT